MFLSTMIFEILKVKKIEIIKNKKKQSYFTHLLCKSFNISLLFTNHIISKSKEILENKIRNSMSLKMKF